MKRLLIVIFLFGSSIPTSTLMAQAKAKMAIKMADARQKFNKRDYWGALKLYREVHKLAPDNAMVNYRMGETQYALKHYKIAKEYFLKAEHLDPEVDKDLSLAMGRTHHRLAELDLAKERYAEYRQSASRSDIDLYRVDELLARCDYAKGLMKSPLDVSIKNLDKEINSRFDDYAPSITADGSEMVFTSRRPGPLNLVDELGDHKYYEDIYRSEWLGDEGRWAAAERLEQPVNSPTHDAVLSLSGDGKTLFIYKNDVNRAGDIFRSVKDPLWAIPAKLPKPINTSYFESSISLTSDGSTLYFISERPGGYGRGDIYVSQKKGDDRWSKPKNLDEVINTIEDEKFVFIHPNGSTLFFASDGHLTMGSYDIFSSELVNGEWSEPVNLGYPINTVNEESTFSMTADNRTLLISAEYEGGLGERDIYTIDLSNSGLLASLNIDEGLLNKRQNITIRGHVHRSDSKPVAFRDLLVLDSEGEIIYTTRTDKDGGYEVILPRDKTYELTITERNGATGSSTIDLSNPSNSTTELEHDFILSLP
jgi:hypothetical protein